MRGPRTSKMNFRTVPYERYDELVRYAFYNALVDKIDEVFSDLEEEYGCSRVQSAEEAFTYDDYLANLGVNDELEEVLYRMGLDVTRDYRQSWADDYDEKVKDGIWNNPDSVALFNEDWAVYDSMEEMPAQPFSPKQSDPTSPASEYMPVPDVRYWDGCPWHRDEDRGGQGALYKEAIDENLAMPLFTDIGFYEIYATGAWRWNTENRITRGYTPVIDFHDDWMRIDEVRYMGERIDTPYDGVVFDYLEENPDRPKDSLTAFAQLCQALCTFFAACEEAGIPPYSGEYVSGIEYGEKEYGEGETVFTHWMNDSWSANVDEGEYAQCLDAAHTAAGLFE